MLSTPFIIESHPLVESGPKSQLGELGKLNVLKPGTRKEFCTNFLFIDQHNRIWYGEPITGIWISDWNNELSSISFEDIDFVVFPNVTDGLTTIAFNMIKEDATIKIIDIVGNNMKIEILPKRSTKMEINISELASGLYIISIEINNSTYTRKVIRR